MARRRNTIISKTRKKEAALLLALAELGGQGTKRVTLDHIESNAWYSVSAEETQPARGRKEPRWRNRFAYIVKTLKGPNRAEVDGPTWGQWAITARGQAKLLETVTALLKEQAEGHSIEPLTDAFVSAARAYLHSLSVGGHSVDSYEDDKTGSSGLPPRARHWSGGETQWHKQTVNAVAEDPSLVGIDPRLVKRRWNDSLRATEDDKRLWLKLRTEKRPDVVFELHDGGLCVIEVEPLATIYEGIAQVAGDYHVNLRVDRVAANSPVEIASFIVTEARLPEQAARLATELSVHAIVVP